MSGDRSSSRSKATDLTHFSLARLRIAFIILIALSLTGMVVVPRPSRAAPAAEEPPGAPPFTDVNPLGAAFFFEREVEPWKREQTLRMAREAGIGWVKQIFAWDEIEPQKSYYFDDKFKKSSWQKYDEIVDLTERYGMRIIARLDLPPAWTRKDNRFPTAPPDNFEDYANFVKTIAARYKGRIQYYQIWHEPNIWPEWGDRPVDAAAYTKMLKAAYEAAKSVDPHIVILSAPLAQTLEESPYNLSELRYLDAMYKAGAKGYFDILLANGYGFDAPPDAPADPNALNFSRLKLLREVMERNSDSSKPVWLNEMAWNASPADFPSDKLFWRRVTEEQQAAYTAQAVQLARSWGWIGVLNTWYFRQVGDISVERSEYFFRIVDVDFTPRPLFFALRDLGRQIRVAPSGTHEETNAAVAAGPGWSSISRQDASGGRALQGREGARVTFSFDGSELEASVLGAATPTTVEIFVDGKNSKTLDLPGSGEGQLRSVTLAQDLRPTVHAVELRHASGPPLILDTFTVSTKPNDLPFWGLMAAAAVGMLGVIASFIKWRRA